MAAKKEKTGAADMESLLSGIDKDFGKGALIRLGDEPQEVPPVFSSGSIALDEALHIGGLPYGRIIEIFGPESSGKTSIALHAAASVQRQGRRVAFIDAEYALDPAWATILGVDTDDMYVSQPDYGEQALQLADRLVHSGQFGLIIVDSVAALTPQAELNGEVGDVHVGLMARMMSQGLRILTGPCAGTGTAIIFINQLREKVGVFFGNPETQPGGKALKFYASIRLDVRRIATLKGSGDKPVGSKVKVQVKKNKLAAPFGVAEFDFMFGEGVSRAGEMLDLGVERKVLKKSGSHYTYGTEMLGNGKDAARRYLNEHEDIAA
jgi:recombination protein RecA